MYLSLVNIELHLQLTFTLERVWLIEILKMNKSEFSD